MKDEKFQEFVLRLKDGIEERLWKHTGRLSYSGFMEMVEKEIDKLAEEFSKKECGK